MSCCEPAATPLPANRLVMPARHPPIQIRAASLSDRGAIEALLQASALPVAGLADATLVVAVETGSGRLTGVAGLETWGQHGLLRSLAVAASRRGESIGRDLTAAVEAEARRRGLEDLALLTTTAAAFFARLGFTETPRSEAPASLAASAEWNENVCPASARFLRKSLAGAAEPPLAAPHVHDLVRTRYGAIAARGGSCCGDGDTGSGDGDGGSTSRDLGYDREQLARLPADADLGLGCGTPLDVARPQPGETVLDLGSGGGLDALLAAAAVGPEGKVIGVDMTPEMLTRSRAAAARAGAGQVEFREGLIEALPVADASVDAVVSNCVINLAPDKVQVFREAFRVLRPGGRLAVSDIVVDGELPESVRRDPALVCACLGGAASRERYLAAVTAAGFADLEVWKDVPYPGFEGFSAHSITLSARRPVSSVG